MGFLDLLMVRFSNLIESRERVEGEMAVLSVKMESELKSEGSTKEAEEMGLSGLVKHRLEICEQPIGEGNPPWKKRWIIIKHKEIHGNE